MFKAQLSLIIGLIFVLGAGALTADAMPKASGGSPLFEGEPELYILALFN